MGDDKVDDIYKYIDSYQDQYIGWLQELCKQPSVAAQHRGIKNTTTLVENYIRQVGGQSKQFDTSGNPVVFGQFDGIKDKIISFYNHYDVQPEDPVDKWTYPPFGAEIHDDRIYARGVADNKGNLIARLAAVDAFIKCRGQLPMNVKFIVEGEEEIGSIHLEEFSEENTEAIRSDGCLWEFGYKNADGRSQVSLGVKGEIYIELICRGAKMDVHSAEAAVIMNPAWRLVWALSTLKDSEEHVTIEHFYDQVKPLTNWDSEMIEQLIYNEQEKLEQLGLNQFLLNLTGNQLKKRLVFQPTCTICGFESGYTGKGSKTVLPSIAKVKLDFRLVPDQDPDEIMNLLREHLDKHGFSDIDMINLGSEKPARTDFANPLVESVITSDEKISGLQPTLMPMSAGTGPMYTLCQQFGIPAVSIGVGNFKSNNHAPDENILVKDFVNGIKIVATIIDDFSNRV